MRALRTRPASCSFAATSLPPQPGLTSNVTADGVALTGVSS